MRELPDLGGGGELLLWYFKWCGCESDSVNASDAVGYFPLLQNMSPRRNYMYLLSFERHWSKDLNNQFWIV